ncbi:MAG: M24 family metallopeptidase, partial [Candidatus Methanoplasma sp.]|nr:M24 family metallopeptidase [Candidatus Methanoplasma sp.]
MERSRAERMMSNSEGLDAIVILNDGGPFLDSTFWYLTEQAGGAFESSIAVVGKDGKLDVIVSVLEEETAASGKGDIHVYHSREERDDMIREALKGSKEVGFNTHNATYSMVEYIKKTVKGIKVKDASSAISSTVSVKDAKEIEATRKACKISSQVAREIPDMLSEGVSEKEIAFRMDIRMKELGGSGNAFDTISAFGANSSKPHHSPTDYKLK